VYIGFVQVERGVSKLLKVMPRLQTKLKLIEDRNVKIEEVVYRTGEKRLVNQEDMISESQKMGKICK